MRLEPHRAAAGVRVSPKPPLVLELLLHLMVWSSPVVSALNPGGGDLVLHPCCCDRAKVVAGKPRG